jgi:hypothetical protein
MPMSAVTIRRQLPQLIADGEVVAIQEHTGRQGRYVRYLPAERGSA